MRRIALQRLLQWKAQKSRKPLLLRGARQVGKTWLVRELGKDFEHFVEFNFESQPHLSSLFKSHAGEPQEILRNLKLLTQTPILPQKTLLFFDEIQECPEALQSLRYFYEQIPDLHIMAAGSLLEFEMKDLNFPVGRLEFQYLFPMNFLEFLWARKLEDLAEYVETQRQPPSVGHSLLLKELKNYILAGGMPEAVAAYCDSNDFSQSQRVQQNLLTAFRADFSKYGKRARLQELRLVFDNVPRTWGKKFKYSEVAPDMRSKDVGEALHLLEDAGLAYKSFHSSGNGLPLSAQIALKKFKVFYLDIGLGLRHLNLPTAEILKAPEEFVNKGELAEQFVAQQLLSQTPSDMTPELYYWHRESKSSSAEVDFLVAHQGEVIPVEVKAGNGARVRSLKMFCEEKRSKRALILSRSPEIALVKKGGLQQIHWPLYMACRILTLSKTEP